MMPSPDDNVPERPRAPSGGDAASTGRNPRAAAAGESPAPAVPDTDAVPPDGNAPQVPEGTPGASEGQRPADDARPREIGGQAGPEPTRYGDWEKKGRCTDF